MITESIVVIVLILLMSYLYVRRGKNGIAASILPLAVLPLVCVIGYLISERLPASILPPVHWGILFVVIGLVGAGGLFGVISRSIKKKSARRMYLIMCGGFTVLFAFAEILALLGAL